MLLKESAALAINIFSDLESISEPFEGILLDAYGVFWGGSGIGLLPGCKEAMERLFASGKIVGILSNSTQLSEKEVEKLKTHGLLLGKHFHFLITSGTVARHLFFKNDLPFPTPNKKFVLFGAPHPKYSSHQALFPNFQETSSISEADFIYISIPHIDGMDQTDPRLFKEHVEAYKDISLPMVCANPDSFAHEGNPPRAVVRQGAIAKMHEQQGGQVFYIGKPYEKAFSMAMESFSEFKVSHLQKILMVGDTPETDIRGAKNFGIASALVIKTGMMADRIVQSENALQNLPEENFPDFFIERVGKNGF